jgi:hypothetical protein
VQFKQNGIFLLQTKIFCTSGEGHLKQRCNRLNNDKQFRKDKILATLPSHAVHSPQKIFTFNISQFHPYSPPQDFTSDPSEKL